MEKTPSPLSPPVAAAGSRFGSFGLGLLLLAGIAVLTGLALLPFYHAQAGAAYPSVAAMQHSAPLRVLRAIHHWTSALLILLGALYLLYGLFTCSYRRPLHLAWAAGVGLVLLFFLFQLTGHLLPWDSQAVSTAAIETGVAATAPVVGPVQARLLRGGGDAVSPQTLTVWYIAHMILLPILLAALAAIFIVSLRRAGQRITVPRTAGTIALLALILLSVAVPAPLGTGATAADYTSFAARSEWYVLPLHSLLDYAQHIRPDLAWVGTMVIPGLVVLGLLLLPWLDRRHATHPPSHAVRLLAAIGVTALLALTLSHLSSMEPVFARSATSAPPPNNAGTNAPKVALDPALIQRGKTLFIQNGCSGCHKLAGQGGAVGPPLDGEGSRRPDLNWQIQHLKDPASMVQGSTMPPFKQLSDQDLKALGEFLLNLKS